MLSDFKGFTIQTFDDQKRKDKGYLAKIFLYDREKIIALNSSGAGIYFVPNPQIEPNQRTIENTGAINYISLDLDVAKEKQSLSSTQIQNRKQEYLNKLCSLAIQPNSIIETKHGYQPLWELAVSIPLESEEKRLQMNERYKNLIKGFTTKTDLASEGDNLCRVIRLPGFYHMKDPSNPFLIKIVDLSSKKFTLEELEKVYPPILTPLSVPQAFPQSNDPEIKQIIDYPVKEALKKLSGSEVVNGETFDFRPNPDGSMQIVINGESKSQWIDLVHNTIGGAGTGQGNPTIIQFVQWYEINKRGEDEKIARSKAIVALKKYLKISCNTGGQTSSESKTYSSPIHTSTNSNTSLNNNGGSNHTIIFKLTPEKQIIIDNLKNCHYRTPSATVASLLIELFKDWKSEATHWPYIAMHWHPKTINGALNRFLKLDHRAIPNPPGQFTQMVKCRPRRKIDKYLSKFLNNRQKNSVKNEKFNEKGVHN